MGRRMPGFTPTIRAVSVPSPVFQRAALGGGEGQRGMELSCTVRAPGADASNQAQLPLLLLPHEAGGVTWSMQAHSLRWEVEL